MIIQKINFTIPKYQTAFKGQEKNYTSLDIKQTTNPVELLKIIDALRVKNVVLNSQRQETSAQLKSAQVKYLIAKGKRDELSREEMKLKGLLADNYNAISLAEKKYEDIVSGQYMKSEKAKQLKEMQIKIDELDPEDEDLKKIKESIGKYIEKLEN